MLFLGFKTVTGSIFLGSRVSRQLRAVGRSAGFWGEFCCAIGTFVPGYYFLLGRVPALPFGPFLVRPGELVPEGGSPVLFL